MSIERIHHAIPIKHYENSKGGKCVECRTEPPNKRNRQRPTQKVGNDNLSESLRFRQDAGASLLQCVGHLKGFELPDALLDRFEELLLPRLDKRKRRAAFTCPRRATDSVHIGVDIGRAVEVDDVRHVFDIDAAGDDIRSDEHLHLATAKPAHHAVALALVHVAFEDSEPFDAAV